MNKVITRFAPSPTGKPHVGNIRTAIFSYLWARHNNGQFLLRIEDTDRERLVPESQEYIEKSLQWLGINFDDEIIYQSNRKDIHQKYALKLIGAKKAYKCFCTKERLRKLREEQIKKKLPPGYDGHCLKLTKEDLEKNKNTPFVVRFIMPDKGDAIWKDQIKGLMKISYQISDDPIIIKSDGWPTYHLASVIDDFELGVTDIIRGEEWISSTPKHLALYEAFGWKPPRFSHMPHINGPDGSKLSKRHGDTAILDYKKNGYLSEAMFNFLALLGWNDGTEKEIFTKKELIKNFDLNRVGKSPAVFDIKKLDWLNGIYIRSTDNKILINKIKELLPDEEIVKLPNFDKIIEIEKSRLTTLSDITIGSEYYVKLPKYNHEILVFKKSNQKSTLGGLQATLLCLKSRNWPNTIDDFNTLLLKIVKENELTNGDVFWPVRVALSGKEKSPSPSELLWALGKEESIIRINKAIEKLND